MWKLVFVALVACGPPPPAHLRVVVMPANAEVRAQGLVGTGSVDWYGPAGTVAFSASAKGYRDGEGTVDVASGDDRTATLDLTPLPQPATVDADPKATITWTHAGSPPISGTTPWSGELPSGDWTLSVSADGFVPSVEKIAVDGPIDRYIGLDLPGQVLRHLRTFATGRLPKHVEISPDAGEIWVASLDGPPSVVVHDRVSGAQKAAITLGEHGAVELLFSPDGSRVYASQMETHSVYEIDAHTYAILRKINVGGIWSKVLCWSADHSKLYVSNWLTDDISEVDVAGGTLLRRIPTVHIPRGMFATADGTSLYVAGFGAGELAKIDLATGRSRTVWSSGRALRHIVGDEAHGRLFVSDMSLSAIFVLDLKTGVVTRLASTEENPNTIALSPDGQVLFVSCRGPNGPGGYLTSGPPGDVLAIDTADGHWLDEIAAGEQPTGLDLSEDGRILAFSDFRDNDVQVWAVPDTATLRAGNGGRAKQR